MTDTLLCILLSIQCVLCTASAVHILSYVNVDMDSAAEKLQSFAFFIFCVGMAIADAVAVSHLLDRIPSV